MSLTGWEYYSVSYLKAPQEPYNEFPQFQSREAQSLANLLEAKGKTHIKVSHNILFPAIELSHST